MSSLTEDDIWTLEALCLRGVTAVRSGRYDAVLFKLFNTDEARWVREFMTAYPDVPYARDWIAGEPDPRDSEAPEGAKT